MVPCVTQDKVCADLTSHKLSILPTRLLNAEQLAMLALSEEIHRNSTRALMAAIWPAMVSTNAPQDGGGGGGAGGEDGSSTSTTTMMTTLMTAAVMDGEVVRRG
jgi:hypothetical protein